ncbi:serine threonine- phosphatase rdgC [Brachionus plicatilis]|uniref:Serine/threonine-protein phosphatase n=1 Tax=Brachionus plicatilis TaxID=10195 RepID=A0A3M7QFU3_BRAPC|nr:serine threonine- phosphatase rdgC [Brachionus plicatilis]
MSQINGLKIEEDNKIAFTILNELEFLEERESIKLTELFDSLIATFLEENQAKDIKVELEPNYNGLKFGQDFEEGDFKQMLKDFRSNRALHALYAVKIIDESIKLLKKLPNICEFSLNENDECIVVGDLHGHFDDLLSILNRFNIPGKYYFFVFNGDWVDRGEKQIEVVLALLYSFVLYPNRVFLNRGNHEDRAQNSHMNYKPCLKIATLKYFGKYGSFIYSKFDELFKNLPFATIVNNKITKQRYFVVHGGINDSLNLKKIQLLDRTKFGSICRPANLSKDSLEFRYLKDVVDMLWSDPQTASKGIGFNNVRNIGKFYGSDVTKKFLSENNLNLIIRSHECKQKGHDIGHDGKVITVFSASNYNLGNLGSVVKISTKKVKIDLLTYNSSKISDESKAVDTNLTLAIKKLRSHLYEFKDRILSECSKLDMNNSGLIKTKDLVFILSNTVPNIPYENIKDRLCECDDSTSTAKYATLFSHVHTSSKYESIPDSITNNFNMLVSVFNMIDSDNNGFITQDEFKKACSIIFNYLGTSFSEDEIVEFINFMDKNKDEFSSLIERRIILLRNPDIALQKKVVLSYFSH